MITYPCPQSFARLKQSLLIALVCCAFLVLALAPIGAQAIEPSETPIKNRLQKRASVDDIARKINQQHKWRILSAEPTVEDEKTFYRFKLLNKKRGRVRVVVIDPSNPDLKYLE